MILALATALPLPADQVDMQNGDRYFGTVLSMSADTVVLKSDVLGVINVPRKLVTNLAIGANAATPTGSSVKRPAAAAPVLADTNAVLSAGFRNLGANTNFIGQVREQLLAGNSVAASNYDATVSGLLSGSLDLDDLRRQARMAADQLRELKRSGGGADTGIPVDAYLEVLDNFLNESGGGPTNAAPVLPPKLPAH